MAITDPTSVAVFLAGSNKTKQEIKNFIESNYYLLGELDDVRNSYYTNETCQGTVPPALVAFLESTDFESAIRNAILLGGDTDTLAAITGSVAEAYYGVPQNTREQASSFLDERLFKILQNFEDRYSSKLLR